MQNLKVEERLIVEAEFEPDHRGSDGLRDKVLDLCHELKEFGVIIKVETALRAVGYDLIGYMHAIGHKIPQKPTDGAPPEPDRYKCTRVMADLKLYGSAQSMAADGTLLSQLRPKLITVLCSNELENLSRLKATLPNVGLFGVITPYVYENTTEYSNSCYLRTDVLALANHGIQAELDGIIANPSVIELLKDSLPQQMSIISTNVWPTGISQENEYEPTVPIAKAIKRGASRVIIGSAILKMENRKEMIFRCLDEIAHAVG